MSASVEPFRPLGEISQRHACLTVFRTMQPGDWISLEDLADQVEELTGNSVSTASLKGATWAAREDLAKAGEVGVEWYLGGFKRLTAQGQVEAATKRQRKVVRQFGRMVNWTKAALANPEVQGPERWALQQQQDQEIRAKDLAERRAGKHRPPASEDQS